MLAALLTVSAVVTAVTAQGNNDQLLVQSIDAQFDAAFIVPDLIASFDPVAHLDLSYGDEEVAPGTPLTVAQTQPQPVLTLTAANSSVTLGDTYTLVLADPGALGGDFTAGPVRHWLANGVTVGEDGTLVVPGEGQAITTYGAPLPPDTDSPHRYVFLLYAQPEDFAPQGDLANPGQPIAPFNLNEYVTSSGLGPIVAGTYFTCTTGEVEAVSTTSAVVTSTLPAAATGSDTSGTNTNTGSDSNETSTSNNNAGFATVASVGTASLFAAFVGALVA